MIDRTTLLFALPGFRVLNVTPEPDGGRLVVVENSATEGGCPSCGVMSSRIKDRPLCRLKDLPHGSVPLSGTPRWVGSTTCSSRPPRAHESGGMER